MIIKLFKDSNSLFMPVVKNSLLVLAVTFVGCEFLQHYYLQIIELTRSTESSNIFAVLSQALTSLLEFVVLTLLVPLRVMELERKAPPGNFWDFSQKHVMPLTIESIRALAITLLWTLLLIVPGIFKYIRFFFVPYVVIADPEYSLGKRDALEYSNQLVKGIGFGLFIFILGLFGLDVLRSSAREAFPLFSNPIPAVATSLLFFMLNIYTNVLLFRLYQLRVMKLSKGDQNGTHV
ncbi:MAG: hypothetical protein KDD38_04330 [Bdellovibrionales bacterium]|nr:hypothetical protein [Bdellovibrionales bacterium]